MRRLSSRSVHSSRKMSSKMCAATSVWPDTSPKSAASSVRQVQDQPSLTEQQGGVEERDGGADWPIVGVRETSEQAAHPHNEAGQNNEQDDKEDQQEFGHGGDHVHQRANGPVDLEEGQQPK
eukprot:scaffold36490_cov61-Phaeocystis_antarctica.AAC.4